MEYIDCTPDSTWRNDCRIPIEQALLTGSIPERQRALLDQVAYGPTLARIAVTATRITRLAEGEN